MRTFAERFADVFSELGDNEQVTIFNEWAYRIWAEPIESMSCFDELMYGWRPTDIALRIAYGDFHPNKAWFRFDGNGNLESTDCVNEWLDSYIVSDLAAWYEEHKDVLTCVCSEMEAICKEENEEDEPEEK